MESISRWIRFPSFVIVASLTLASWDVGGRLDLHARGNNTIGAEERSEGSRSFVRFSRERNGDGDGTFSTREGENEREGAGTYETRSTSV